MKVLFYTSLHSILWFFFLLIPEIKGSHYIHIRSQSQSQSFFSFGAPLALRLPQEAAPAPRLCGSLLPAPRKAPNTPAAEGVEPGNV